MVHLKIYYSVRAQYKKSGQRKASLTIRWTFVYSHKTLSKLQMKTLPFLTTQGHVDMDKDWYMDSTEMVIVIYCYYYNWSMYLGMWSFKFWFCFFFNAHTCHVEGWPLWSDDWCVIFHNKTQGFQLHHTSPFHDLSVPLWPNAIRFLKTIRTVTKPLQNTHLTGLHPYTGTYIIIKEH